MRWAIPRRHICLTNCPGRGRPLNGNVIRYLRARVATSASRGAFSAFAAHQHQKTGPFVFPSTHLFIWRVFSCTPRQTFSELPDANKVNFVDSPGVHLSTLLPHLDVPPPQGPPVHSPPAEESTAVDLLQRFLIYPPDSRFGAEAALRHPWILSGGPLVLPRAALANVTAVEHAAEMRDGRTAAEWLKVFFVSESSRTERGK